MNMKGYHYIDGRWLKGAGPRLISTNPATDMVIWEGNTANKETVDQAVSAAKAAFPAWSGLAFSERVRYIEAFKDNLLKEKSHLIEAIARSTGKPFWEAATEVTAMANKADISIEAFKTRCPTLEKPQSQGVSLLSARPHGVMAVLGPFNFPGHLPNGHILPALLAGNTVVFKPSELTPLVAELTIKCWESSGLPSGVINLVQGGKDTGCCLSENPEIDGLLFTGSWSTGQHLAAIMAKTPYKILALEMGGNNPLVIGTLSNFKTAAYVTIQSAFITSGQRCTCARRLIVPLGKSGDDFIAAFDRID